MLPLHNADRNYSYTDDISAWNTYPVLYYRIRQVDNDGRSVYSNVAPLKQTRSNAVTVWPNPFSDHVIVSVTTDQPGVITMKMMNSSGQLVRSERQTVTKGTTQLNISNLASLSPGIYMIRVEDKDAVMISNEKLLKRN